MKKLQLIAAVLFAIPLIVFGGNYFLQVFPRPEHEGQEAGVSMLTAMCDHGLMDAVSASHVLIGIMLVIPKLRFLAALLQLPLSIGIVAFHVTMLPEGNAFAFVMLALNLVVIADPARFRAVLQTPRT